MQNRHIYLISGVHDYQHAYMAKTTCEHNVEHLNTYICKVTDLTGGGSFNSSFFHMFISEFASEKNTKIDLHLPKLS